MFWRKEKNNKKNNSSIEETFFHIYKEKLWNDPDSVSGPGSNLKQTAVIQKEIPGLLRALDVRGILDLPCGDFFWMKNIDLKGVSYVGGDIVDELVTINNTSFGSANIKFRKINILTDTLPKSDLILCRDCLVHFSFQDIIQAMKNILNSGATYILITHFTDCLNNRDIKTGDWRQLNLRLAPFLFPKPLLIINEGCTEGDGMQYSDKSLALWRLCDFV